MNNPVVYREIMGVLRTRKAVALLVGLAVVFCFLVLIRWPTDSLVERTGTRAKEVFQAFGYGLLTVVLLVVPALPATSIVREKNQGTLLLLLNSPLKPGVIYLSKVVGSLAFIVLMLTVSLPAAAACYAMGGAGKLALLYPILLVAAIQYSALGLLISTYCNSVDSALRITYSVVLLMAVVTLAPHLFFQGGDHVLADIAGWLRCVSPIPAAMEILGHRDVGTQGLGVSSGATGKFLAMATLTVIAFAVFTLRRLNHSMFDRTRAAGTITNERSMGGKVARRAWFLIDPQRRKSNVSLLVNPVMVKEFRSRRFGRLHWLIRLVAVCAIFSLALTIFSVTGTIRWNVEIVGGIMVIMQIALIVLVTPSLGSGLISGELESGSWQQLQMTPLSAGRIVRGKLMSVILTLLLVLCATLPAYAVMIAVEPKIQWQVTKVLICLSLTAGFAIMLSAAVSSLFRTTAPATATAYGILVGLCAGTTLVWLARDKPFGHSTVESALTFNPMAAALSVMKIADFGNYSLVPGNWWFLGAGSVVCVIVLTVQTWRLTRPR